MMALLPKDVYEQACNHEGRHENRVTGHTWEYTEAWSLLEKRTTRWAKGNNGIGTIADRFADLVFEIRNNGATFNEGDIFSCYECQRRFIELAKQGTPKQAAPDLMKGDPEEWIEVAGIQGKRKNFQKFVRALVAGTGDVLRQIGKQ